MSSTVLESDGWHIEFQVALLRQAPRPGEIDQVVAEGWVNNQKSLKKNLGICLLPILVATRTGSSDFLDFVGTVKIPATTDKFVARKRFVINIKRNASVKISYLGNNFTEWFLSGTGKTEDPIMEQTLRYAKLRKPSVDVQIIAELGGEKKAETTLSEAMFFLTKKKYDKYDEEGVLSNSDCTKIFYIRDSAGVLRTVSVYLHDVGWLVNARSVESLRRRGDGCQVFSRLAQA